MFFLIPVAVGVAVVGLKVAEHRRREAAWAQTNAELERITQQMRERIRENAARTHADLDAQFARSNERFAQHLSKLYES